MSEVQHKIEKVRGLLAEQGGGIARFRGTDWFAWATGGGDGSVIFASELAVAEVVISQSDAVVLTNAIEADRMRAEQLPREFELKAFPWQSYEENAAEFVKLLGRQPIWSDRPANGEQRFPAHWQGIRLVMQPEEVARYRRLGREAAMAVTEALDSCDPGMTEFDLAGLAALTLWQKGIHPMLTLVAGEERLPKYRHPVATGAFLGSRAMLVVCGRRHGLYANLTRHVFFREPTKEEQVLELQVAHVEVAALRATEECRTLPEVYERLQKAYAEIGAPQEISRHHQGGPTGYLSREFVAGPVGEFPLILPGQAFAWNPSLPGAKIEDTVLLDGQCEILTVDPRWPTTTVEGRARPAYWIRG